MRLVDFRQFLRRVGAAESERQANRGEDGQCRFDFHEGSGSICWHTRTIGVDGQMKNIEFMKITNVSFPRPTVARACFAAFGAFDKRLFGAAFNSLRA